MFTTTYGKVWMANGNWKKAQLIGMRPITCCKRNPITNGRSVYSDSTTSTYGLELIEIRTPASAGGED